MTRFNEIVNAKIITVKASDNNVNFAVFSKYAKYDCEIDSKVANAIIDYFKDYHHIGNFYLPDETDETAEILNAMGWDYDDIVGDEDALRLYHNKAMMSIVDKWYHNYYDIDTMLTDLIIDYIDNNSNAEISVDDINTDFIYIG